jgi:hypothetical protein
MISMLPDPRTWVSESGKVVLMGDAAHGMHPYLSQVQLPSRPFSIPKLPTGLHSSSEI